MWKARLLSALACVVAVPMGVLAAPAHAEGTTSCNYLDEAACLHYNSHVQGAFIGVYHNAYDYAINQADPGCTHGGCPPYRFQYYFTNTGIGGLNQAVKNNAASACSDEPGGGSIWFYIYYYHGYAGPSDFVYPQQDGCTQLTNTYNENASQEGFS